MSNHSRLSPSSAHRWMLCPGSVREEAKYPDKPSGEAAIDGTHSHTLLELCVKGPEVLDPNTFVGHSLEDHEGPFVVDDERAARVKVATDYVIQRKQELGTVSVRSEEQVDPAGYIGRDDMKGTADVQLIGENLIEIIDYKDGMTPVLALNNPQLITYAIGAIMPYRTGSMEFPFGTVKVTIVQPKLGVMGKEVISSHEYSLPELLDWARELRDRAAATDDPNAPLVAGESQCKWCDAKGNCSAQAGNALEKAQVLFGDNMAEQSANRDPNQLDDSQLVGIIEAAPLIKEFLVAVEAEAMRRMETGQVVPGLKIVRGRGSRKWNIPDEELETKLKGMGVPKASIYTQKIISPAQAEKLKWTKKGEPAKLSAKQLKRIEDNYITKSQGAKTVVLDSDSRTAINTDAATMFKDIEPVQPATPALPAWLS